ncbi:CYTH domain-containing protein [Neobacillus kokaensis]|nr:CYTH domain-containing protein [Neobacillus kokaensis]
MTQNLEIEFKNMLTKQEYEMLLQAFHIDKKEIFTQENHYFDTLKFSLKNIGSALRIRRKKDQFEMTLKQPAPVGLLETNQLLSREEAAEAIQAGKLPTGKIEEILEENSVQLADIQYFGSLVTNRVEVEYEIGLLVLDHSLYLNREDYELEFEVEDYPKGKEVFHKLLKHYGIPIRETENKIRRFYQEKYEQTSSS